MPHYKVRRGSPFNERINSSGGPNACWPYLGAISGGYGSYYYEGRNVSASAYAFFQEYGYWAEEACHTCNNPPCCNPRHIYDGDRSSNMKDKVMAGTSSESGRKEHLTDDQLILIRTSSLRNEVLASQMGLDSRLVRNVRAGESHKRSLRRLRYL